MEQLLCRVERCRFIGSPYDIVVCTTKDSSDNPLVETVERLGFSVFRGATDDIVRRLGDAMAKFEFDAVVQVDGGDPFSATEYMDLTMETLIDEPETDIVTVSGLPLGRATKSFRRRAMQRVLEGYVTTKNDTGFIYFFTRAGLRNHVEITVADAAHVHDRARLTLDYPDDLEMMRKLVAVTGCSVPPPTLSQVVHALHQNPQLVVLNIVVDEAYWQRTAEKAVLELRDIDGNVRRLPV